MLKQFTDRFLKIVFGMAIVSYIVGLLVGGVFFLNKSLRMISAPSDIEVMIGILGILLVCTICFVGFSAVGLITAKYYKYALKNVK